jgi:Domain of unknown function (DUF4476)
MQKPGLFGMNGLMVFLLTCFSVAAHAQQQGYLILIDAESKEAFTVRVGEQLYSSSVHGHLVLSHLKDSTYRLNLRFVKENINEQIFPVVVHQKDLGLQLKGADNSWVLYNWQTRETIHPVYEKDSSRLLELGVKREDGFSRLMAAVVDDSAVMYNTYAGNGFSHDTSAIAIPPRSSVISKPPTDNAQLPTANHQPPTDNTLPSTANSKPPTDNAQLPTANHQPPTTAVLISPEIKPDKDSLIAVRRQQIHSKDSLSAANKAAQRDSSINAKRQQIYLKDSLATARRAFLKDSLQTVRMQRALLKDSLLAARKAAKDSLLAAKTAAPLRTDLTKDSLLAAQKEAVLKDSLMAVNRANAFRDSLAAINNKPPTANRQTSTANHQLSAKSTFTPGIKKLREISLKISRKMVFLDVGKDGQADTITIFVYFETADTLLKKRATAEPVALKKSISPDTTLNKAAVKKSPSLKPADIGCVQVATDTDTQSLRSAILQANTEQEKITLASGSFAAKCYSVSQVRLLASLFVSDKARYRLMDAAHMHIVDRDHFPQLVDMLTDKNFQRKFMVMAEKRS